MKKNIKNIYEQIQEALRRQSAAYWRGDWSKGDLYERFIHARCLRIEELKNVVNQPTT